MPPWPRSLGRRNLPGRRGMRAWIPRSVVACSEPERAASPGHLHKQSRDSNSALEQESEWWVPGGGQNLPAGPGDKLYLRLAPVLSAPCGAATGSRIQNPPSPGQSPCWPLCSPSCHVLTVLARPPREPGFPSGGCHCRLGFLFQLRPKVDWTRDRKDSEHKLCQLLLACKI